MDDDQMPLQNFSIKQFCDRALQLHHNGSHDTFVQFVLNGNDYQDVDSPVQIVVDPFQDSVSPQEGLTISRDFDSVLGLGTTICVDHDLTVFPASKHEDTLSKNIHLTHRFQNSRGFFVAPIHKVPNNSGDDVVQKRTYKFTWIRPLCKQALTTTRSTFLSTKQGIDYDRRNRFLAWSLNFSIDDDAAVGKKRYVTRDTGFRDAVWGEKTCGWAASAHRIDGGKWTVILHADVDKTE